MATIIARTDNASGVVRWQAKIRLQDAPRRSATFASKREAVEWAAGVEDGAKRRRRGLPTDDDQLVVSRCLRDWPLPKAPNSTLPSREDGWLLPDAKGVYCVWRGGQIIYVGRATGKTGFRGRLLSHNVAQQGDELTLIPLEKDIGRAECWYIALLNPPMNRSVAEPRP